MNEISRPPPSGYRIEQAMSVWEAARERLLSGELAQDEAALTEILGAAEGEVDDVLARVLRAVVFAEDMEEAAAERAKAIAARKQRYAQRGEYLRGVAMAIMDVTGKRKAELGDLTASVTSGRQVLRITDADAIPDKFVEVVTERKPDKAVLLSTLKAGEAVEGCELSNGSPSISIRTH